MTDLVAASKQLAFVLRHDPASVGLVLDPHGWVDVTDLLAALAAHGQPLSADELDQVIAGGDKRRFERRGSRIRALHGHSIPVTWDGPPTTPPAVLYHGTVVRFLPAIRTQGLRPGQRRWVHLSADPVAASDVGARRGRPVVLRVDAAAMHTAGHEFFRSGSVWLTATVPPQYLPGESWDATGWGGSGLWTEQVAVGHPVRQRGVNVGRREVTDRDFGLVSAHRGGVGRDRAGENSRAALERAAGLGCEFVEFDVQVTADGQYVLLHDSRLAVAGRTVPVSTVRYETLVATLGDVVRLGEAAQILRGKAGAHVDLKLVSAPGDYARPESTLEVGAVKTVLEHLGPGDFIVTSQADRSVRAVRDWSQVHAPGLLVGLSLGRSLADAGPRFVQVKLSELFPRRRLEASRANLVVAKQSLARLHVAAVARRLGLPLLVWTVDRDRRLRRWLSRDRAWLVTTNRPGRALDLRAQLETGRPG